jgi:hypothetical protein
LGQKSLATIGIPFALLDICLDGWDALFALKLKGSQNVVNHGAYSTLD